MPAISETVLLFALLCATVVILGAGWIIYLARGGRPFDVSFEGLGISIAVNRPGARKRVKTETDKQEG